MTRHLLSQGTVTLAVLVILGAAKAICHNLRCFVRAFYKLGIDAGVFPHPENNKDFALLAGLGMRPTDVLRAATTNAAELIGTTDRGVLTPGKLADVVVFNSDPSRNIALTETRPTLVMLGREKFDLARLTS